MLNVVIKMATCFIRNKHKRRVAREKVRKKIFAYKRYINNIVPSRDVQNLLDKIEKKDFFLAIVTIPFEAKLFQRPQQLFLSFSKQKQYCVYFSNSQEASIRKYTDYLDLANMNFFYSLPDAVISKMILIVPSTSTIFTEKDIMELKKRGCQIIYEYIDEIDEKITSDIQNCRLIFSNLEKIAPLLIVATAKKLEATMLEHFCSLKVMLSPNGVDAEFFSQVDHNDVPIDLKPILDLNKPIIGYYGALAGWLDWDLINELPKKRTDYQFVYIGVDYLGNLKRLNKGKNVHFLGAKDYRDLAKYSIHFDCCMIPFGDKKIAEATSPLKLFEYMGVKKTVVCTGELRECEGYEGVLMSQSHEEFILNLDRAILLGKDKGVQEKLFAQASQNTWDQRAANILLALNDVLKEERRKNG